MLLLGNPVLWLWDLLAELLAGGTLSGGSIPAGAGYPFVIPPEKERTDRSIDREQSEETRTSDTEQNESPGEAIDSAPEAGGGGGGGGFDSPGETIDAGFGEGDADGGSGDGE